MSAATDAYTVEQWTDEHGSIAYRHGWGLFETCGTERPIHLERDDELETFQSDPEAWLHVVAHARTTLSWAPTYRLCCEMALLVLLIESPDEFEAVMTATEDDLPTVSNPI